MANNNLLGGGFLRYLASLGARPQVNVPNASPPGEDPDTWRERSRASTELAAYDTRRAEQRAHGQNAQPYVPPLGGGLAALRGEPAQPAPLSYSGMGSSNPTPVLGNYERDRMQQDNTGDADAWWRNRGNY